MTERRRAEELEGATAAVEAEAIRQPHVRGAVSLVGGQRLDESVPVPSECGGMKRGSVRERLQNE